MLLLFSYHNRFFAESQVKSAIPNTSTGLGRCFSLMTKDIKQSSFVNMCKSLACLNGFPQRGKLSAELTDEGVHDIGCFLPPSSVAYGATFPRRGKAFCALFIHAKAI